MNTGTKNIIFCTIVAVIILLSVFGCQARKSEITSAKGKITGLDKIQSNYLDYSKILELDKSFVFIKEYQNGMISKETLEQKNKVTASEKIIKSTVKIYSRYNITKTIKIKETRKEAVSNWVYYFAIAVAGLLIYFKNLRY